MKGFVIRRSRQLLVLVSFFVAALPACAQQDAMQQRVADLEAAVWVGDHGQATQVLATGVIPPVTSENICWLHFAIGLKRHRLMEPLIEAGVPKDCKYIGLTALQYAVANNRYRAAEELIRLGASVNQQDADADGNAPILPLNYAVQEYVSRRVRGLDVASTEQLIRMLLQHGADPNLLDKPGSPSKLCIAAEQGQTEMVQLLLSGGADVNQISDKDADEPGVTALECALFLDKSNIKTIEALLYAGADPTAGPHANKVLQKAKENMPQAVSLLEQYGAR